MEPVKMSMRKTALTVFGGNLYSMYDVKRFENRFFRSRYASTTTRKDYRVNGSCNYRPWQMKGAYNGSNFSINKELSESEQ